MSKPGIDRARRMTAKERDLIRQLVAQRDALAAALTEMLVDADMFREPYINAAVCERAEAALAVKNPETQP